MVLLSLRILSKNYTTEGQLALHILKNVKTKQNLSFVEYYDRKEMSYINMYYLLYQPISQFLISVYHPLIHSISRLQGRKSRKNKQ